MRVSSLPEVLLPEDSGSQLEDERQRTLAAEQHITRSAGMALTTKTCLNLTEAVEQQNKFANTSVNRDEFAVDTDVYLFV